MLRTTLLVLASSLGLGSASAQEESPPDAKVEAAKAVVAKFEVKIAEAREALLAELRRRIEAATDEAVQKRLEFDLQAFESEEILPASLAKEARKFAEVRATQRRLMVTAANKERDRFEKADDQGRVARMDEVLEELLERRDLAAWTDLRCHDDFEDSIGKCGFAWQGAAVVPKDGKGGLLRVPSSLDGTLHEHYQLRFVVERVAGEGPLRILFPLSGSVEQRELGMFVLDAANGRSGLDGVDKQAFDDNETTHRGRLLGDEESTEIVLDCKANRVRVEVDGKQIVDFGNMRVLSLPPAYRARFANRSSSIHLLTEDDATFAVSAIGFRPVNDAEVMGNAGNGVRARNVADQLAVGRTWRGKTGRGLAVTAKVVGRNRASRTATIELKGKNGWHVRLTVKSTGENGSQFEIERAARLDAPVKLTRAGGNGHAGSHLQLKWEWANHRAGKDGYYEDSFQSQ